MLLFSFSDVAGLAMDQPALLTAEAPQLDMTSLVLFSYSLQLGRTDADYQASVSLDSCSPGISLFSGTQFCEFCGPRLSLKIGVFSFTLAY